VHPGTVRALTPVTVAQVPHLGYAVTGPDRPGREGSAPMDDLDELAIEAMMALIDAVHGPLRNDTALRGHVAAILAAATQLGMGDPVALDEATATLRAYTRAVDLIS
jgi:hypothetical protein